ncbi:hypothetical protein GH714_040410 [Hevea brasiliensis]|uniref:Nucleoside diphosphate kinase n=1 Tax=Hevea brasiliensis TaxID=3981 RepID=A0A6A6N599_HEVBR|nr:hypothetical protein GH714_040410 [Hevea brasiliensis]
MNIERVDRNRRLSLGKAIKIHKGNYEAGGTTIGVLEDSFQIALNGYVRPGEAMEDRDPLWVGEIISRFEKKGFSLKGLKLMSVERPFAEKHYEELSSKPFFEGLVDYIISGPVAAMVWEGKNVVATGRKIIGATKPSESDPGTIRGDFAVEVGRNVIHGSDSVENAKKEIALWFPDGTVNWQSSLHSWIYE